jgi:hypothetical protein
MQTIQYSSYKTILFAFTLTIAATYTEICPLSLIYTAIIIIILQWFAANRHSVNNFQLHAIGIIRQNLICLFFICLFLNLFIWKHVHCPIMGDILSLRVVILKIDNYRLFCLYMSHKSYASWYIGWHTSISRSIFHKMVHKHFSLCFRLKMKNT